MTTGRQYSVQRRGSGWFAVMMALVLALSWQSVLTQTHDHRHVASLAEAAPHYDSGRHHQDDQAPSHLPAHCLTCRAAAHAGAAVLPAPVVFVAPSLASFQPAAIAPFGISAVQRSHRWQSRAPPALQA